MSAHGTESVADAAAATDPAAGSPGPKEPAKTTRARASTKTSTSSKAAKPATKPAAKPRATSSRKKAGAAAATPAAAAEPESVEPSSAAPARAEPEPVADLDTVHAVSDAEPVADGALAPTIPDLAEKPDEPAAARSWPDPSLVGPVLSSPPPTTAPSPRLAPPLLRVCPNCGRTRLGQFRYCLTCGFDYDVAERASSVRPWLTNVTQAEPMRAEPRVLIRTPIPGPDLEALPPPVLPPEAPPPSGAVNVGAGRFTVSRGMLIAGAIGVGVAAAILVSLFALVLGRLF